MPNKPSKTKQENPENKKKKNQKKTLQNQRRKTRKKKRKNAKKKQGEKGNTLGDRGQRSIYPTAFPAPSSPSARGCSSPACTVFCVQTASSLSPGTRARSTSSPG